VIDVIRAEDFDEDAELQANIWNSLVNTNRENQFGRTFMVTAESILSRHRESIIASRSEGLLAKSSQSSTKVAINLDDE